MEKVYISRKRDSQGRLIKEKVRVSMKHRDLSRLARECITTARKLTIERLAKKYAKKDSFHDGMELLRGHMLAELVVKLTM